MHVPDHFSVNNATSAYEIMRRHSFATLVSGHTTSLTASHLPLLWTDSEQGHGLIQGHMARANSQWQDFSEDSEVMAIFTGPDSYISPNWYVATPAVPTWNYTAVHAYGTPRVIDDQHDARKLLRRMVAIFDSDPEQAWPNDQPQAVLVDEMIPHIVAFEISIVRLEAKAKLSQNRSAIDQASVIVALQNSSQEGARALAKYMRNSSS